MEVKYELHHGDCLEWMPKLRGVSAIVTDPPYGIAKLNRFGSRDNKAVAHRYTPVEGDDKPFDPSHLIDYPIVSMWGANWYADKLPPRGGWLIWDKRNGGTSNDFSDAEMAWTNVGNTVRLLHHKWQGMIRDSEIGIPRVHPTQKPIAVMKWNLQQLGLKAGDTVCDPYMGSGTTGVACAELGINFIGIDLVYDHYLSAQSRIEKAYRRANGLPKLGKETDTLDLPLFA